MKIRLLLILILSFVLCSVVNILAQQDEINLGNTHIRYVSHDFRDPFDSFLPRKRVEDAPSEEEEVIVQEQVRDLPEFSIQGLIWGGKMPQAIIDNAVVMVGDEIEEAEVIAIDKKGVTFLFDGQEYKVPGPAFSSNQAGKIREEK